MNRPSQFDLLSSKLVPFAAQKSLVLIEQSKEGSRSCTITFELYCSGDISLWLTCNYNRSGSGNFFSSYTFSINWPAAQKLRKLQHVVADLPSVPITAEMQVAREADYPIAGLTINRDKSIFRHPSPLMPTDDIEALMEYLFEVIEISASEVISNFSSYCNPHVLAKKCLQPTQCSKLSLHEFDIAAILAAARQHQDYLSWRQSFEADPLKQEFSSRPATQRYLDTLQRLLVL